MFGIKNYMAKPVIILNSFCFDGAFFEDPLVSTGI